MKILFFIILITTFSFCDTVSNSIDKISNTHIDGNKIYKDEILLIKKLIEIYKNNYINNFYTLFLEEQRNRLILNYKKIESEIKKR